MAWRSPSGPGTLGPVRSACARSSGAVAGFSATTGKGARLLFALAQGSHTPHGLVPFTVRPVPRLALSITTSWAAWLKRRCACAGVACSSRPLMAEAVAPSPTSMAAAGAASSSSAARGGQAGGCAGASSSRSPWAMAEASGRLAVSRCHSAASTRRQRRVLSPAAWKLMSSKYRRRESVSKPMPQLARRFVDSRVPRMPGT
mmetsp:Transcript_22612/g.89473  ORF Transcript_22612/g.89473 Transcript_22612/m.89473 type:complete len:202 (-) Transcript_22612:512-1117(-)